MEIEYGTVVSTKEAELLQNKDLPGSEQEVESEISSVGNALWYYKNENTINGIKVAPDSQGLPIDREDLLNAAFTLTSVPRSLLLWLSPDDTDSIAKYEDVLRRVADGSVLIQEEIHQYDANKGKFMVWVKYTEVSYRLHPRFQYLREEMK